MEREIDGFRCRSCWVKIKVCVVPECVRGKIGKFIRQIDYLNAKESNDYEDSSQNPCNQLNDLERKWREDMTLADFKDAYAAFEEKICIKCFPERRTGASEVAISTGHLLTGLANYKERYLPDKHREMCAVMFHALVALVKAGPSSTQRELMEQIRKHTSPNIAEYAQTLGRAELLEVMSAAKIEIKPLINTSEDADSYTSFHEDQLEYFFAMFTKEQFELVQKEFLDTYIHLHHQIPELPDKVGLRVYYLIRAMPKQFEKENPYWNLKDVNIIKSHITALKEMLLAKGYTSKNPVDQAAEMTMEKIIKAVINDGYLEDVFDHMVSVLVELHKNVNFRKQGKTFYEVYTYTLFRDLKGKQNVQHAELYKGCVTLVTEFVSQGDLSDAQDGVLEYALRSMIESVKKLSPEDVNMMLSMIDAVLGSGRVVLIKQAESLLKQMMKIKALDWKKHLDDAKQLLGTVAKVKIEDFGEDREGDKIARAYLDLIQPFRDQLKKQKVLPQLQPNLVDFIFNCIPTSAPKKAELAWALAERDYLDISKHPDLRLVILRKAEEVLRMELPWDDGYMIRAIGYVLVAVVVSYDDNGKLVTDDENQLFMSIFKMVSEGGETVEEHFYQEEHEDRPNYRMAIWRDVLMNYVRMHRETATLSLIAPIMPEVLRWAKISLEEEHENMMRVCYGILNWVGAGATPTEFKTCLPEIVDLMLESEKFSELYSIVNSLYPEAPDALHDRLDDIFNKMDDLKESERHTLMAILYTVSQKHPEAFQQQHITKLFKMYETGNQGSQHMILMTIRAIGDKHPKNLAEFLPILCDDNIFKPESLNFRSGIIAGVGGVNKQLGEKAIDYLMTYVDNSYPTVLHIVTGTVSSMVRQHVDYMQKYKPKIGKMETTSTVPGVKDLCHDMILVLEGKSIENIADDVEQQKDDIADLDTKVDATMGTVITLGDKVIEHDKEIGELEEGLGKIEERVDDVEVEQEEAKIKIEEIDNKTMTNAPKWSRDLTKLMNPEAAADWRLLASRLGYSNDDIRAWASQHDPCMALLSEWYATHRTSEANYGVLTALVEMNRMDGAAIVENAMKMAEGVVEDEEFEYPSPPPVFISYQWGFQNEVKLLKQHLNMAGYECWMDVGQMGGGDKLFAKIDNGIRGAKVVICCTTEKYAQSPNCNREVNLSVNLNKPIIPLLMEKMDWPPKGSMGPIFSEYLFIRFFQRGGEETPESDQRYWPIAKFQELLMQLNFYVVPDQKLVKKEYDRWWAPMVDEIVIDKNRSKKKETANSSVKNSEVVKSEESPLVFLSYQWGKQPQVKALYQRLSAHGYTVWMDIYQMGGGDSLYDKIDRGMRGCKAVVSCVTQKYSLSANCRREVSLADALKKPIIPLLLEDIKWPPDGPMSMVFTQLLYINFHRYEAVQMTWECDQYEELRMKLGQFIPDMGENSSKMIEGAKDVSSTKSQAQSNEQATSKKAIAKEQSNSSTTVQEAPGSANKGAKDDSPTKSQTPRNNQTTTKKVIPKERPTNSTKDQMSTKSATDGANDFSPTKSPAPKNDQVISRKVIPTEISSNSTTMQGSARSANGEANGISPTKSQAQSNEKATSNKAISNEQSNSSTTVQGSPGSANKGAKDDSPTKSQTPRNNQTTTKKVIPKERPTNSTKDQMSTKSATDGANYVSPIKSPAPKNDQVISRKVIPKETSSNSTTMQGSTRSANGEAHGISTAKSQAPRNNQTTTKSQATTKYIPKEKSTDSTTVLDGSEVSGTGKQKREYSTGGQSSNKTPIVPNINKAVAVRAFGGSIVKDKIALDIAAGKRSTTPKSTVSKGQNANASTGTKEKTTKTDQTPARGTPSTSGKTVSVSGNMSTTTLSGKGTLDRSNNTSEKSRTKEKNASENANPGKRDAEGAKTISNIPNQTNNTKESDVNQSQNQTNPKQVNGGSNEPKSKSCIIL